MIPLSCCRKLFASVVNRPMLVYVLDATKVFWPIKFPYNDVLVRGVPMFFLSGILCICSFPCWVFISGFIKLYDLYLELYYKNRPGSHTPKPCWVPFKQAWMDAMPMINDSASDVESTDSDATQILPFMNDVENYGSVEPVSTTETVQCSECDMSERYESEGRRILFF